MGWNILWTLMGSLGVTLAKKNVKSIFFRVFFIFFHGQRRTLLLVMFWDNLKGTVGVISNQPPFMKWHVRFMTLSFEWWRNYHVFMFFLVKWCYATKGICVFLRPKKLTIFQDLKNMFEQIKYNSRVPKAQAQCLHLKFSDIWYSVTNLVLLYTMYFSTQLLYCLYTATQRSSILTIYEYFFLCFICLFFKQIVQN